MRLACVYRYFDTAGVLLYIGSAYYPLGRHNDAKKKPWGAQIHMLTLHQYPSRQAAFDAEKAAIISELPRYNAMHMPKPENLPALVAARVASRQLAEAYRAEQDKRFDQWLAEIKNNS